MVRACSREEECVGVVELLLERGADASVAGSIHGTPLVAASSRGYVNIVPMLLAHWCGDIDAKDEPDYCTALQLACDGGHVGVARLLLGAGADPTITCDYDEASTALDFAAASEKQECVALLEVGLNARPACTTPPPVCW
jgi:ankyrin repeat protein